jgi:hypothetical protein
MTFSWLGKVDSTKSFYRIPHILKTNPSQWQREIDRNHSSSSYSTMNGGLPNSFTNQSGEEKPIKVLISEAWSWSKFSRTIATRLVYGILLMTGLSVLLEQQGILKGG